MTNLLHAVMPVHGQWELAEQAALDVRVVSPGSDGAKHHTRYLSKACEDNAYAVKGTNTDEEINNKQKKV